MNYIKNKTELFMILFDFGNLISIKMPVFPFKRFPEANILLGPEMKSTGEVMCRDKKFDSAYAKALMACGNVIPTSGTVLISDIDEDYPKLIQAINTLNELEFKVIILNRIAKFANSINLDVMITKINSDNDDYLKLLTNKEVCLVISTNNNKNSQSNDLKLRRTALLNNVLCVMSAPGTIALIRAIKWFKRYKDIKVYSLC